MSCIYRVNYIYSVFHTVFPRMTIICILWSVKFSLSTYNDFVTKASVLKSKFCQEEPLYGQNRNNRKIKINVKNEAATVFKILVLPKNIKPPVWEIAVHLAVACGVYGDVFLCCPFSHEVSWMRS